MPDGARTIPFGSSPRTQLPGVGRTRPQPIAGSGSADGQCSGRASPFPRVSDSARRLVIGFSAPARDGPVFKLATLGPHDKTVVLGPPEVRGLARRDDQSLDDNAKLIVSSLLGKRTSPILIVRWLCGTRSCPGKMAFVRSAHYLRDRPRHPNFNVGSRQRPIIASPS